MTLPPRLRAFALGVAVFLAAADRAHAQSLDLRDLLTDFLRRGISLAPPSVGTDHSAHFIGESFQFDALEQVNAEIAFQLSSFPLSSSAGGFAYRFDPALGVFNRPTRSFGPVYTERAFNVGKGKINLGVNYSYVTYDKLDDLNLRGGDMRLVFNHEDSNNDGSNTQLFFEGDLVTTRVFMDIRTSITALVATYGVTDRFDFGVALPVVDVEIDVAADATLDRLSTANNLPDTHVFPNGTPRQIFNQSGSASGLGDVVLRGEYNLANQGTGLLSILGEIHLPTGDDGNLLGTGALKARASLVGTLNQDPVAAHGNLGYGITGEGLPEELSYSLGVDWAVDPKITVAADLLGRRQADVRSVFIEEATFTANTSPSGPPNIIEKVLPRLNYSPGESRNVLTGSVGFKINFTGSFLLSANGQFPLTDKGLRDDFSSLIGVDYSF